MFVAKLIVAVSVLGVMPVVPSTVASSERTHENVCAMNISDTDPPAYYRIELVPTKRVPGTGLASGFGDVSFRRSPFSISVTEQGNYAYDIVVSVEGINYRGEGTFVVWLTTSDLESVQRVGELGAEGKAEGVVDWNKFLVVVTLEPDSQPSPRWRGPVVLRGISRSGLMHTMAGHGPFSREPCASYGY